MSQIERDAVAPARVFLLALFVLGLVTLTSGLQPASQAPAEETLPGIVNFTRIDSNVAVGGAVSVEALPELKRRGFKAVINLRKASEANVNVEAEGDAVRAAGLRTGTSYCREQLHGIRTTTGERSITDALQIKRFRC